MTQTVGKRILLIINPIAGKLRTKRPLFSAADIFTRNGYQVDQYMTEYRGHAIQLVKEHARDHDIIVCSGGDGTLNEVVTGMQESGLQLPLGYIPSGTTNDYATSLRLSYRVETAVNTIIKGRLRKLDIGIFEDKRYFNYIASFGAFTESSYSTPQTSKNSIGHLAYLLEGMKDIPNIRPCHVRVEANGNIYEDDYIFGAVSNSTSIGGMIKLDAKMVNLNDGLFEIMLIKNPKTPLELSRILRAVTKRDYSDKMIEFIKASEAVFIMDKVIPWTLDGEYEEGGNCIHIRNKKDAILLLA